MGLTRRRTGSRARPARSLRHRRGARSVALVALGATLALAAGATSAAAARRAPARTKRAAPLRVIAVSPRQGAAGVGGRAPISITFSAAISPRSPLPSINPQIPGSWHRSGDRLTFVPDEPFVPLSQVTVSVPGGRKGLVAKDGQRLARRFADNFSVENGSIFRLQQLLSLLDYSPLAWAPASPPIAPSDTAAQLAALYSAPKGAFHWRNAGWPSRLVALWRPGAYNVFTRGLVMSFQADHGLDVTGNPSGGLWNDLVQSLANGIVNTGGYNYAIANKTQPQSLTIWHDGSVVLHAPANTGIPQSPTPSGTFPVYARYRNEIMHGTNPDGSHYADPVQYVAYFYDGDAVHYFPRADYGVPQSLGCVELALPEAAAAWPYLAYGTLVTVVN
ncbi:MAG: L,D-transpeptidase family protein [Actinomycetota bacterium]|nr:L,D-transpeptidase family protein [Actinomycetota bacterium]